MNRDESYLLDISRFAQEAQDLVSGMDAEEFAMDRKAQLAVLYDITVLGEAVKKLSPEFRQQHSAVAWKQIAGMRDKLIHDYRNVNIPRVWQVLQINIPELLEYIQPLLPKE
jgi:uncharacterized protein with HEPN domain